MIEVVLKMIAMTASNYFFVILFFFRPGWLISYHFAENWRIPFRVIWITLLLAPSIIITPGVEAAWLTPFLMVMSYYWLYAFIIPGWNIISLLVTGVIACVVVQFLEEKESQKDSIRIEADKIESGLRLILAGLVFLSLWWPWFERRFTDYRPSWLLGAYTGIWAVDERPLVCLFLWLFPFLIPVNVTLTLRPSSRWTKWLRPASKVLLTVLLPLSLYFAFGVDVRYLEVSLSDNGNRMLASVTIIVFGCLIEATLTVRAWLARRDAARQMPTESEE